MTSEPDVVVPPSPNALLENMWTVLFTGTNGLVQKLQAARRDPRLEAAINHPNRFGLLILDDLD